MSFPSEPEVPESQRASGTIHLRYEDVSQDGRLVVTAIPQALGEAVWKPLLSRTPVSHALRDAGVIPILSRLHVLGGAGRVSVRAPLQVEGCYQTACTRDAAGEVERLLVLMWARVHGPLGRTHGPHPEGAGTDVEVGRVYAEHVLTRPFGPPAERKVRRLDPIPMPETVVPWRPAEELLELPDGADPIDDAPSPDEAPVVFGLDDTDSNMHVNSLVHPRIFREAGLRRLAARGLATSLLVREVELAYRKPCFAGERHRTLVRAFRLGDRLGVVGCLLGADASVAAAARPHCFARVHLAR